MRPHAAIALILALWLTIVGQANSSLRLAELLHGYGIETSLSSASAESHQQGHCFSGFLTVLVGTVLLFSALLLGNALKGVRPSAHYCLTITPKSTTARQIRAPPSMPLLQSS